MPPNTDGIALRRIEAGELITTDAREETDRELTTFLSAYETAVDTYDDQKLERLINAEAVAWVERRGETGRAGIIGALRGDGAEPLRLAVRDPRWIIGTGRWDAVCSYDVEIGGSPSTARSTGHVTDVLKVIDGNWQIIYRHESR